MINENAAEYLRKRPNLDHIKSMISDYIKNSNEYYAPYTAVIQSSGFGKSRIFQELANEWNVHYLVMRNSRTQSLAGFLINAQSLEQEKAVPHLASYFYVILKTFSFFEDKTVKEWNGYFKDENQESIMTEIKKKQESWEKDTSMSRLPTAELYNYLKTTFEEIKIKRTHENPLVVVFDEARELLYKNGVLNENNFFILRNVIAQLPKNYVFVVFIDTNSKLSNFMPEPTDSSTALCEPIYLFPTWNVHIKKEPENILEALSNDNLFGLGRPLWGSLYKCNTPIKDIINSAVKMLCGGQSYSSTDQNAIIAVIASRTGIDINKFSPRQEILVKNYMAVCVHVSKSFRRLTADYLSEPLLAEASAILFSQIGYVNLICTLKKNISQNEALKGHRGEIIMKFILLSAWDQICAKNEPANDSLNYHRMVRVEHFLTKLCGKKIVKLVKEQNVANTEKFLNGYLFFTHFVNAKYKIKKQRLKEYLNVGAAISCFQQQIGCDFVLPVVFDTDNYDDHKNISFILIQVKNLKANTSFNSKNCFSKLNATSSGIVLKRNNNLPYMAIYAHVGKSQDYSIYSIERTNETDVNIIGIWVGGYKNYKCLKNDIKEALKDFANGNNSPWNILDKNAEIRKYMYNLVYPNEELMITE